jgi:anaerobic magnesium-protoporphyrin IX monomethyl ester cyclase
MHAAGLRAMSFGVESVAPTTLKKVGRRPIPEPHQREVLRRCRELGIVTAAFYVIGFAEDTWESIGATIEYSIDLGSTVAQFKILTPYPGTPLFKRMQTTITETDWERFDGFTPTFSHPSLTHAQLSFLLGHAYTQYYVRPSFVTNYLRIGSPRVRALIETMDAPVRRRHTREVALMARTLSC